MLTPDSGFEGVLHFAAKIEVAESVARPDLYWDVNVGGTMAVLNAVRVAGVQRMLFSSTGSMYDPASVVPLPGGGFSKLTEDAVIRPKNPYAATKLAVDLMLAGECEAFGLGAASPALLQRLGRGHGDAVTWASGTPRSPHLIPIVLQVAGGKRDQLMMYGDDYPTPDGTCVRDYIHVADLADRAPPRPWRDQAGPARGLQPGQRRRLQRQAGHRGGPRGHRPPDPGQAGPAPPRRPGRHGRRERQGPP